MAHSGIIGLLLEKSGFLIYFSLVIFKKFIIFLLCSFSFYAFCRIDSSLVLDGRGNYHEISDHNDLDFNGAMTIEAWIRPNCTDQGTIVSKQWCKGQFAYSLNIANGKIRWAVSSAGTCSNNAILETNTVQLYPDVFTHIAITHTNSAAKIFVNGQEVNTTYISGSFQRPMNSNEPFRIGAYKGLSGAVGSYYSGLIDELRFWKKEQTATEIQQGMNTALNGNETDLVLYLDMEDYGVGSAVNLRNKSTYGSTLNPRNLGTTAYTPYFTDTLSYKDIGLNLPDSFISCQDSIFSISPTYAYSIEWSDLSTDTFNRLTQAGLYWVKVETERCRFYRDSIEFIIDGELSFAQGLTICRGDTITIGNQKITSSGMYYDTVINPLGCDTFFQYSVSLFEPSDTNLRITACSGDTIQFMSKNFLRNTDTAFVIQNYEGCDSTINLKVQFLSPSDTNVVIDACEGDVISFMGKQFTSEIDTTFTLINALGCDSVIYFAGRFLAHTDTIIYVRECKGEIISFLGRNYTQSIDTVFILTNANGCDSTILLRANFIDLSDTIIERTICMGKETNFMGVSFSRETDTTFIIPGHMGCDSIVQFKLNITESLNMGFLGRDTTLCANSYPLNSPSSDTRWSTGQIIQSIEVKESGLYMASFTDADGCLYRDSVRITLLDDRAHMPNAFTPNRDGMNDCLRPVLSGASQNWDLSWKVYSRWGELIFQSNEAMDCWDGTYLGESVQGGNYLWHIIAINNVCSSRHEKAGVIHLLR